MQTNPKDPVRNIRLFEAKNEFVEGRKIWNDLFLDRIRRYSGIRFMDWMHTNNQ
jgi:hypothetical protein